VGGEGTTLGLAHGVAGELWSAVEWCDRGAPLPDFIPARAAELLAHAEQDETAIVWPARAGEPFGDDFSYGLCNGMAGHAVLWATLSARGVDGAAGVLERIGKTLCALGPALTPGLCCGLTGQSLAHRHLSGVLARRPHERRAFARMLRAATWLNGPWSGEALSLMQGALGIAMAALILEQGEAHLPGLEPPAGS
jgi:hypothetical protein